MTLSDSDLHAIVERVVRRTLGDSPRPAEGGGPTALTQPAGQTDPGASDEAGQGLTQTVALGADHGGLQLKETLKVHLESLGYAVTDCGTHSTDAVDYPDVAYAVARLVGEGRVWRGIVIDGAGIGSAIAANKVPGVRAALCYDHATSLNSREHNNANVLSLGAGLIGATLAKQIVEVWLKTEFGGGRHARRVDKIAEIERRFFKTSPTA